MMNNTLLFDLEASQPNHTGKRHGGGRYAEVVFERIVNRKLPVAIFYNSRKWLNPDIKAMIDKNNIICHDIAQTPLQEIVDTNRYTTLYSALPFDNIVNTRIDRLIGTQHGLRTLETPFDPMRTRYPITLKARVKHLMQRALSTYIHNRELKKYGHILDRIEFVAVSSHTANSIKAYFPQYRDREIKVFYSPSTSSQTTGEIEAVEGKYFLIVSANRWDKNGLRGIMALDRLFTNGFLPGIKARITGAKSADIFKYHIQNLDRFEFMGYVDDRELEGLYKGAIALIYPSLNEGFGYPPIEAMKYGTPVLASPFTSIPEVCGDAAIYFNPWSVEEIMARIIHISDPAVRDIYSARAHKRYEEVPDRQTRDLAGLIDYIYGIR